MARRQFMAGTPCAWALSTIIGHSHRSPSRSPPLLRCRMHALATLLKSAAAAGRMRNAALKRSRLPSGKKYQPPRKAFSSRGCPHHSCPDDLALPQGGAGDRHRHDVPGVHGFARQHQSRHRAADHRARPRRSPRLPWLITVYLLAATAVVPLYGKIADIYGRKFTLRIAIMIYMVGSLCARSRPTCSCSSSGGRCTGSAAADSRPWARSCSATWSRPRSAAATTPISRWSTPRPARSGRRSAASSPTPALVGDLLAQHPARLHGAGGDRRLLRRLPRHQRPHKLDVIGAVLIVTASISFMLAINLGGVRYRLDLAADPRAVRDRRRGRARCSYGGC